MKNTAGYFANLLKKQPNSPFFHYALGLCYRELKKLDLALDHFKKSIKLDGKIPDLFIKFVDTSKDLDLLSQARKFLENRNRFLPDSPYIHFGLSYLCRVEKKWNQGLVFINRALKISSKFPDAYAQKGDIYLDLYKPETALESLFTGLKMLGMHGDKHLRMTFLNRISVAYYYMSDFFKFMEYNQKGLKLARQLNEKHKEIDILENIVLAQTRLADYTAALITCQKVLNMAKMNGRIENQASILHRLGIIYFELGDNEKALDYYFQNLALFSKYPERKYYDWHGIYNDIGLVYMEIGDYRKALGSFNRGLELGKNGTFKWLDGILLLNTGHTQLKLGQYQKGRESCLQALKICREIGNKRQEGYVLNLLGRINLELGNISRARELFAKSLKLGSKIEIPEIIWTAHHGRAICDEKSFKFDKALNSYLKAIKSIDLVRQKLQSQEMKSGFLQSQYEIFESLIDLLVRLHQNNPHKKFDEQAFYYLEKFRARTFLDSLAEAQVNIIETITPELVKKENQILKQINRIQTELTQLRLTKNQREKLLDELRSFEDDYTILKQEFKYKHPEYASLVFPEPPSVKKIQNQILDDKTAIVEYLIGEKSTFAFLITMNGLEIYKLKWTEDLTTRINAYLYLIRHPGDGRFEGWAACNRLYKELVFPFREGLNNMRRLIIIPDGLLHYLPFETLISNRYDKNFLVENFEIAYVPSVSVLYNLLKRERKQKPKKRFLGFANPVYLIPGKSKGGNHQKKSEVLREYYLEKGFVLSPLLYSEIEIKNILKYFKKKLRDLFIGEDAKEERLKKLSLSDYNIIHFATHGLLNEDIASRTALVFSLDEDPTDDGFFQVREIYDIRLNADMVVLSACQSGRGKIYKGEGVSGLARAFLFAGSKSVVASLWNINDKSTSIFMTYFYDFLSRGMTKMQALQMAKLKMIKSAYSHPFYWAAFILTGDGLSSVPIPQTSFWERLF